MAEKLFLWGITSRSGKRVGYHTVNRILTNPIYIGLIIINGETYQGSFKPLISKALFVKVQKVLKLRSKPRKRKHKHDFPFLGLLTCGECGASITAQYAHGNGGTYRYYRCTKRLTPNCSQKYLREDLLLEQLKEKLNQVALSKSDADKMLNQVAIWEKENILSASTQIKQLDQDIKNTEQKLNILVDTFLDGNIEKEIYLAKKDELLHKKTSLIGKREHFKKKGNNWNEPLKNWIIEASSVEKIASSKNLEEIKRFFEKIGTNRHLLDKKIEIDFEKPWNILTFSEDTLRNLAGDRVRSTPEKFSKNVENSLWWR